MSQAAMKPIRIRCRFAHAEALLLLDCIQCYAMQGSIFLTPNKAAMWLACEVPRRAAQHCLADAFTVHVQLSMLKPEMLLVYSQIFVTFVLDAMP